MRSEKAATPSELEWSAKLLLENKLDTNEETMGDRVITVLGCSSCKDKNYIFQRGKKKDYKIEIKKFCRRCGKSTQHKESKQ